MAAIREIIFDTETTGLSPEQGHRIVELGCVELINKVRTGKFFHKYINPERDMPIEAFKVHGLDDAFLSDKPKFIEVADEFLEFIGEDILVIHNASFDMGFINFELAKLKKAKIKQDRIIDTLAMAKKKFPGAKANLDALCNRFNIDKSKRDKHGALLDAELLAEVYIELLGGKQGDLFAIESVPESKAADNPANNKEKRPIFSKKKYREPRIFLPTEEEINAHREFIAKIKNNLWGAA